ncbi:MAG: HlyC/CorC family transporter [Cryomorphaceae bacterium]|nr:HlyC/CorC family transporter [Cryomorphaceae bacterium]
MTPIGFVLISLAFSAFFSGMEIAFISANRFEIELENKKGNIYYRLLSIVSRKPSWFIAAMLVGNNLALVLFGLFFPDTLDPILGWIRAPYILLLVQTLISTIIILVVAEFVPKSFFSSRAMDMLRFFSLPAIFIYFLFFPIVALVVGFSNFILRVFFGERGNDKSPSFSMLDLNNYVKEYTDTAQAEDNEDHEIRIFRNALELSTNKVRDFMVPRTEIIAMDIEEDLEALRSLFIEHNVSKILIFRDSVDNIIGYVHSFEFFNHPENLESLLRPIRFIPESMSADAVLKIMTQENRSIAVVLDEFGVTSGMVTLEDVVEELFGEIDDEHDTEDLAEDQVDENTYIFSTRLEIDYLNETYALNLITHDGYATLGGYITHHLERIPKVGEVAVIDDNEFTIIEATDRTLVEVKLRKVEE